MVRHIPHGGVVVALLLLQQGHDAGQKVVGIEDGVVIGVGDGLTTTILEFIGLAHRGETGKFIWVAQVIGRTMTALLVQHQQQIALMFRQLLVEPFEHHLVKTLAITAPAWVFLATDIFGRYPVAGSLAARIIILP